MIYSYKAIRKDDQVYTAWFCRWCKEEKCCCLYEKNRAVIKKQYKFVCSFFEGVDELGILCSNPAPIHGLELIFGTSY